MFSPEKQYNTNSSYSIFGWHPGVSSLSEFKNIYSKNICFLASSSLGYQILKHTLFFF
jgi:hypothetical protein